jgi:hypothetical protein
MSEGGLLQFFHDAGANKLKGVRPVVCGRMLLLNMRVEVGTGTCHVIASGARQPFVATDKTTFGLWLRIGAERYKDGHTSG